MWYACSPPPKPFIPPVFYPRRLHYRCTSKHCRIKLLHKCRWMYNRVRRTNRTHPSFTWDVSTLSHALLFKLTRDAVLLDWRKRPFYLLSNRHKPFMERFKDPVNACLQLNNQWMQKIIQDVKFKGTPKFKKNINFALSLYKYKIPHSNV